MNHYSRFPSTRAVRLFSFVLCAPLLIPCQPFPLIKAAPQLLRSQRQGNFNAPGAGLPDLNRARQQKRELISVAYPVPSTETFGITDSAASAVATNSESAVDSKYRFAAPAMGVQNEIEGKLSNAITSFTDVPATSPYYSYIETIKNLQVTLGCDTNLFCPNDPVNRQQMAAFIMRSLTEFDPPAPQTQRFTDVPPSNPFYKFIDRLAALSITLGCDTNIYCPLDNVTRGQMVTFLERAVGRGNPPAPAQPRFVDVPGTNPFYRFIESFVQHGMARGALSVFMRGTPNEIGLDGQHFLPDQNLTRAEMAALLVIEFGWMDGYTSNARLDPINRIGQSGEDLFSGNCNWSLPLLGLPGRAGLDLGLSLSYNSLVWTKVSPAMIFNADNGFSPGFQLGFPVIQTKYSNSQAGGEAYMMVSPSGARVELRRVGSTNEYDSADSSYLRLDDNGSTLLLRTTDGTQLTYSPSNSPINNSRSGDYRCTQIKDRNGNFLTINYHPSFGHISTIVDTLSRTVTFSYDNFAKLISISQTWNGATHTWASFGYSSLTMNTNFCDSALGGMCPNMSVCGPPNNGVIAVLSQVNLDSGLRYNFDYTTWGQIRTIHRTTQNQSAPDLSYSQYDLPQDQTSQRSDCPRFSTRTDYALDWSTVNTQFIFDRATTGFGKITTPDGTVTKETHASSGYNKGLTTQTDTYSSDNLSTPKRTVTVAWTQDNTGVSYPLNPRVTETNTTDDASNHRRTTIGYSGLTLPPNSTVCNLPSDVREFDSAGTTVLRKTHTDYDTTLLNQHIIGRPSARYLYDTDTQGATPLSKVTYGYDASGSLTNQGEPVQHDSSYGTGFTTRGNSTSVSRWDVTTLGGQNPQSVTSTMSYNTAGDLISTTDPASHQTTFSYADSFSTTGTPLPSSTLAYPTTVTNADSKSTTKKYDYDIGGERLTTNPKGATQSTTYDAAGRTSRIDISSGGYTRFDYPTTLTEINTYTFTQTGGVEFYSTQVFDGAGRMRATASDFPGSSGLYRGQYTFYDAMGRVSQQSNTTEINSNWTPTGDDAQSGWLYRQQTYDWKGRPRVATNTDTTTRSITYGGCGCAGGEVVTNQDEVGRQQRLTYDVLGRAVKTESLNQDQNHSVYATRTDTYNARDQITNTLVQQGTNGTGQQTLMTYDGYGRLSNRKTPIEDTAGTSYLYNADDTVQKVTDARGASSTYTYNGRHLITLIHYAKPGGSDPQSYQTPLTFRLRTTTPAIDKR